MTSGPTVSGVSVSGGTETRCLLCGSGEFRTLYRDCRDVLGGVAGSFDVLVCVHCGQGRTHPQLDPHELARYYTQRYVDLQGSGTLGRPDPVWRRSLARVRDGPFRLRYGRPGLRPRPGRRLLEIGAGGGIMLGMAKAAGWDVWAVEPDSDAAEVARRRVGIDADRILVARAEEAEFPERSFDAIVLHHAIEHLHDPEKVLRRARTWMAAGAELLVACPDFGSRERRIFRRHWVGLDVPRHLHHFTRDTLVALLDRSGFRVTSLRPHPDYSIPLLSLLSAIRGDLTWWSPNNPGWRAAYLTLLPAVSITRGLGFASFVEAIARPDKP